MTRQRKKTVKKKVAKKKAPRRKSVQLSQRDHDQFRANRAALASMERQLSLARAGYNVFVKNIQQAYNLPDQFHVDAKGRITWQT